MPIQYKPHLNAQAKEVEGKLQSSWGELSGDAGQNLQDDAQQVQACAMNVGQAVEEKFKAFVDKAKNRATQIFSPTANGSAIAMNNTLALPLALFGALPSSPTLAQVELNIQLGQPNYYGGLNIQGFPNPQLYYSRPILIQPLSPEYDQPVYLRVPPYQRQNWGAYCGRYNACQRKVYFVRDNWYRSIYAPRYRNMNNDWNRYNHGSDSDGGRPSELY
jgi:uncharacterized protein YjbJ (UPF0337 family)